NRLKKVLGSVISEYQSAYLSNRNILDGPLIINEVITWLKKDKAKAFLFKIDFEKAFDSLNWNFIDKVFEQMGFPDRWRIWIRGILSSARASVLVNGAPTAEFDYHRGLRQGDPLSPFIFIVAMEALSCFMNRLVSCGVFKGISLPGYNTQITHLIYADDVLMIGEWEDTNVYNLARFMRCFYLVSGLKINIRKSSLVGIGLEQNVVKRLADKLNCRSGSLPFTYLGLQVGANMNRIKSWDPVIQYFDSRLSKWKAETISIGGRCTLVKAVLDSLPTYYFSLYKAPMAVINKLELIRRRFLWGNSQDTRKIHWVAWDKVVQPKVNGGLGLGKLKDMNVSLLSKWWWRFKTVKSAFWKEIIMAIHSNRRLHQSIPVKKKYSGVWVNIYKGVNALNEKGINIDNLIEGSVKDGGLLKFWLDTWIDNQPLKEKFPLLYNLEYTTKKIKTIK
ncbi:MAG: reverse transcriptase family protein, partial [Sweet potato little leaf phytoplasma]|nr:reverse transcriptase family protein [Sweet potato little leaf phytoplasma]